MTRNPDKNNDTSVVVNEDKLKIISTQIEKKVNDIAVSYTHLFGCFLLGNRHADQFRSNQKKPVLPTGRSDSGKRAGTDKDNTLHNKGIVIKYNANQKYTTDAVSAAIFKDEFKDYTFKNTDKVTQKIKVGTKWAGIGLNLLSRGYTPVYPKIFRLW